MTEPTFLVALAITAGSALMVVKTIVAAITGRRASRSELAQLQEQLEQQAAALQDAEAGLAHQATQLAEIQERLDFAERLLAQGRDRSALGPGEKGG